MKLFKQKITWFILLALQCCVFLVLVSVETKAQVNDRSACGKLKNFNKSFEKSKKNQDVFFEYKYELVNCPEGLPVLRKYALDSDSEIRAIVLDILHNRKSSMDELRILVEHIKKYQDEDRAISFAKFYPCRFFQSIKSASFTKALINITKKSTSSSKDAAIYLLGCSAKSDKRAFNWLQSLSNPKLKTNLSSADRSSQLLNVAYARAELGIQEAVSTVVSKIEQVEAAGNFNEAMSLLDRIPYVSNCSILNKLSNFITNKNGYSGIIGTETITVRLSEKAIEFFTLSLGENLTGEKTGEWSRLHTDQELEQTQNRVRSGLNQQCLNGLFPR